MAKYHFFRTRVSETRVPHQFCHCGTAELECAIKKNYVVLELGKLEYYATQYSSIPGLSTFYKKKNKKITQYSSLVNSSTV